ncbi:MAG: hypothetical protein D6677_11895 [Calditrichaeota bacterium]|nr:MAG: hypothetical protein D6677_11895 [Calditrichota bacterium]
MFRFITLLILGYLVWRFLRNVLSAPKKHSGPTNRPGNRHTTQPDFQQRHKNEIEDADFEDIE